MHGKREITSKNADEKSLTFFHVVLAHYKNSEACSVYLAVCVLGVSENMDTLEYRSITFL